jgi:hypothetical protein
MSLANVGDDALLSANLYSKYESRGSETAQNVQLILEDMHFARRTHRRM